MGVIMELIHAGWISPESISTDLNGTTKKEIFEELSLLLEKCNKVTDREKVLKDIWIRESISETLILNGIALPHAKSTGVTDLCGAIGISHHSENNISAFFMIVWPENTAGCLKRIATLTDILKANDTHQDIETAKTPEAVFNFISSRLQKADAL
jgi:nitrogen PTS system EIIA component